MAGKKKQPPKPPSTPAAQPAAPASAQPGAAKPQAAPAAPAHSTASSAKRPAAARPSAGRRQPPPPGRESPLGIDWDELPTINIHRLPYWTMPIVYSLIITSFIFLAMVYVARNTNHPNVNRISIIPDMDNEPRWKTQQANYMFADHRASRPWPDGTVARGMLDNDDFYYRGIVNGQWATSLPPQVTVDQALIDRGRSRFNIYCSPCHGEDGYGNGMVAQHADLLKEGTWTPPLNYHTDQVRSRPDGHIFNTITNGIRTMPPYGSQIPVADRWAIVAWIRVLQASQDTAAANLPPDQRAALMQQKPAALKAEQEAAAAAGSSAPAAAPGNGGAATTPAGGAPATPANPATPPAGGTSAGGASTPPAAPAAPAGGSTK
jgi:mono/diheme cytochrome c family protein